MFSAQSAPAEDDFADFHRSVKIGDAEAPLVDRVRSYLAGNCASCHRPGGTGAGWDARFDTPLAKQGIIGGEVRNNFGIEGGKIVAPKHIEKSLLHVRMGATAPAKRMPPVTRDVPDEEALAVIKKWIESLPQK